MFKKILFIIISFYLTGCAAAYLDGTTPTDATIGSACQQPDSSSSHK